MADPNNASPKVVESIPLDKIKLHGRCRDHDPAKLSDLTASIKLLGQLEPARGRPKDGVVELYIGRGRYEAIKALGDRTLDIIVAEKTDEQVDLEMLHENLKREDYDPITEAKEYQYNMQVHNWNQDQMAEKAGISQDTISNSISLLRLAPDVQDFTRRLVISKSHGVLLAKLESHEVQSKAAKLIVEGKLSVERAETLVALIQKTGQVPESVEAFQKSLKAKVRKEKREAAGEGPSQDWSGLPEGVHFHRAGGWSTLRWADAQHTSPKALLDELLKTAPESFPALSKAKRAKPAPTGGDVQTEAAAVEHVNMPAETPAQAEINEFLPSPWGFQSSSSPAGSPPSSFPPVVRGESSSGSPIKPSGMTANADSPLTIPPVLSRRMASLPLEKGREATAGNDEQKAEGSHA